METSEEGLQKRIWALLRDQRCGVLSTLTEDGPYASLVAFAAVEDLSSLYFATPRGTQKYRNLLRDGRSSLLVDNARNESGDFAQACALTVLGTALELREEERDRGAHALLERFPELHAFLHEPTCAVFRLGADCMHLVERFQSVQTLRLSP